MLKVAVVIWVMLGTVLAGSAVVAVLTVGVEGDPMKVIPLAALVGVIVAMPLSYLVAARIGRAGGGHRTA